MDRATPLISTEKIEAWFLHFLSDVWATAQDQTELVAVPSQNVVEIFSPIAFMDSLFVQFLMY